MGRCKDDEARLSGAPRKDKRKWTQTEIQEIAFKHKGKKNPNKQVTQTVCGVTILGDIKNGHSLGQLALGNCVLGRGMVMTISSQPVW